VPTQARTKHAWFVRSDNVVAGVTVCGGCGSGFVVRMSDHPSLPGTTHVGSKCSQGGVGRGGGEGFQFLLKTRRRTSCPATVAQRARRPTKQPQSTPSCPCRRPCCPCPTNRGRGAARPRHSKVKKRREFKRRREAAKPLEVKKRRTQAVARSGWPTSPRCPCRRRLCHGPPSQLRPRRLPC
jgi:hypothetical protein